MTRLPRDPEPPHRDDDCPERGAALSHITDGSTECIYCHQCVVSGPRPRKKDKEVDFTDREVRKIEFLRWLYRHRPEDVF